MQGMHVSSASCLTHSALPAPNSTNAAVASWKLGALSGAEGPRTFDYLASVGL